MKKLSQMSDRELLEEQIKLQSKQLQKLKSINGWVIFLGIITIVSLLLGSFIIEQYN